MPQRRNAKTTNTRMDLKATRSALTTDAPASFGEINKRQPFRSMGITTVIVTTVIFLLGLPLVLIG